jgi:hypothetical protein
MEEIKTKMKKELLARKEFTDDFATTYQYLISYSHELINNLELFGRVINNEVSAEESQNWFNLFYVKVTKKGFSIIPTLSNDDITNDYKLYREHVKSELRRVQPLVEMHYYSMLSAAKELENTNLRIKKHL